MCGCGCGVTVVFVVGGVNKVILSTLLIECQCSGCDGSSP